MNVSTVYLKRGDTGELVEASLTDEVTNAHLSLWDTTWSPVMQAYCAKQMPANTPEDYHWDWQQKAGWWRPLLGYHSFALLCRNELQGMMLANDFKSARLQEHFGKPVVYIEFLATAPWNRPEFQKPIRYRGVGTVMIAAAVELSFDLGYRGRVALHSLSAAERFYRDSCRMTELGTDAAHQDLMYFEMTSKQAEVFRQKS